MSSEIKYNQSVKWLSYLFGTILLVSFFLPWVSWLGIPVKGYDLPGGRFFSVSDSKFGLANPFPQLSFAFYIFWLIPAGVLLSIWLVISNKKVSIVPFITGALSLALVTVFFLFTKQLIMLGVGENVWSMLRLAAWLHAIAAIGLILVTPSGYALLKKSVWILAGPVFVFISFLLIEKQLLNRTYDDTAGIKAEYTVTATGLIQEFAANDSAANHKYREKIISVNGQATEVQVQTDSTVHVKFADATGSYIIFSLDKDEYRNASLLKAGDAVSLKGSCSGSVYSDILGTTSISFKRATLNKQ